MFLANSRTPGMPSLAALRKDAIATGQQGVGDSELPSLLRRAEMEQRPRSENAHALCSVLPHLKPQLLDSVQLPQRLQEPAQGKLPSISPAGLMQAHVEHCVRCAQGRPCSGPPMVAWVGSVTLPLNTAPPAAALCPDKPADEYIPELASGIEKLLAEGTMEVSDDVAHYSPLFIAWKRSFKLSQAEMLLAQDTPGGPLAVARQRAFAFTEAYRQALGAATSSREVRQAWAHAEEVWAGSSKARVVCDLSSLTKYMHCCKLQYPSLREFLAALRPGDYIVKLDLKSGFHLLPLHPSARRLCGAKVRLQPGGPPVSVRYARMVMGAHSSPLTFCMVTAEVLRIFKARTGLDTAFCYVDDLYFRTSSLAEAESFLAILKEVLTQAGLVWSPEKTTITPATSDTVLGVVVDSVAMTATLPLEKQIQTLTLAAALADLASSSTPVPLPALGEIGGRLTWWGCVDEDIPCHTRTLAAFSKFGNRRWGQWRSSAHLWGSDRLKQLQELDWLLQRAASGALMGTAVLPYNAFPLQRSICFAVDASGEANSVALVSELGCIRVLLPDCAGLAVPVLELLGMALIYLFYGKYLEGITVYVASDAQGACHWLAQGKSSRDDANDLLRIVRAAARATKSLPFQRWLSRYWNFPADRVAAQSPGSLMGIVEVGAWAEVTLQGLPYEFLRELAGADFAFSREAWDATNARS